MYPYTNEMVAEYINRLMERDNPVDPVIEHYPVFPPENETAYYCPVCDGILPYKWFIGDKLYCKYCGQAIRHKVV